MDHQQVPCCKTGANCTMPAFCLLSLTLGPAPLGMARATPERPMLCNVLCGDHELRRLLLRHLCICNDSQGSASGACKSICWSRVPVCLVLLGPDPLTLATHVRLFLYSDQCCSAVRSTASAALRAVRRGIRSAAVYCGVFYCVVESRSGVNRLEMQSTLQIRSQILV